MLDVKKLIAHILEDVLNVNADVLNLQTRVSHIETCVYPVGFYLWTSDGDYDPNDDVGGEWELMDEGLTLVSAGVTYTIQSGTSKDGGDKDAIIPIHSHSVPQVSIGSSGGHTHTVSATGDDSAKLSGSNPADVKAVWRTPGTSAGTNRLSGNGAHTHTVPVHTTIQKGEDPTDKNMMPYKAAYCWHRYA